MEENQHPKGALAFMLVYLAARAYGRPLASPGLGWATYALLTAAVVRADVPLVANQATVWRSV